MRCTVVVDPRLLSPALFIAARCIWFAWCPHLFVPSCCWSHSIINVSTLSLDDLVVPPIPQLYNRRPPFSTTNIDRDSSPTLLALFALGGIWSRTGSFGIYYCCILRRRSIYLLYEENVSSVWNFRCTGYGYIEERVAREVWWDDTYIHGQINRKDCKMALHLDNSQFLVSSRESLSTAYTPTGYIEA